MKKRDWGTVHKIYALVMYMWIILCVCVVLTFVKVGHISRYVEDCLVQANLAALVIDPYHYGSTGEFVFEDVSHAKEIWDSIIESCFSDDVKKELGIEGEIQCVDFRIYEVLQDEILERKVRTGDVRRHDVDSVVLTPAGNRVLDTTLYTRIELPIKLPFQISARVRKEHCVDVVSMEKIYEE